MRRGSLIFTAALFLLALLLLKATWAYSFKAKIFPLITLVIIIVLLVIALNREVLIIFKETKATETEETDSFSIRHATVMAWMVGTVFMLWILGFLATVLLLPFLYLRWQRESWLLSLTIPIGCGLFFYGVFGLALGMPFYPGLILAMILV